LRNVLRKYVARNKHPHISLMVSIATVAALVLGAFTFGYQVGRDNSRQAQTGSTPQGNPLGAFTITSPADGATVPYRFAVRGEGSPTKHPVWLAMRVIDQRNWYLGTVVNVASDGTWSQDLALGAPPPADHGLKWTIALIDAPPGVNAFFQCVLANAGSYSRTGVELPSDAVVGTGGITVTRDGQSSSSSQ
jgi:hypothetical protein